MSISFAGTRENDHTAFRVVYSGFVRWFGPCIYMLLEVFLSYPPFEEPGQPCFVGVCSVCVCRCGGPEGILDVCVGCVFRCNTILDTVPATSLSKAVGTWLLSYLLFHCTTGFVLAASVLYHLFVCMCASDWAALLAAMPDVP